MLLNATHSFIYKNISMNRDYLRLIFRFFLLFFFPFFFFISLYEHNGFVIHIEIKRVNFN